MAMKAKMLVSHLRKISHLQRWRNIPGYQCPSSTINSPSDGGRAFDSISLCQDKFYHTLCQDNPSAWTRLTDKASCTKTTRTDINNYNNFHTGSIKYKETLDSPGSKNPESASDANSSQGNIGKIDTSGKYCIIYTCKVCKTRSSKLFTKQAYHEGIVIVRCPGCENHHLIADNLGWFDHVEHRNIVDLLESKGEKVTRSTDPDGNIEITLEDIIGSSNMKKLTEGHDE